MREVSTLSVLPLDHSDFKLMESLQVNGRELVRRIGKRHHLEYVGPIIWRELVGGVMTLMQIEVISRNNSQAHLKGDGKSHD